MSTLLKIEGIYDLRTFSYLKTRAIKSFGFDFSPKSFNFLQTKVFLNEILPKLDRNDWVFLKFDHVFDPMVDMLLNELAKSEIEKTHIVLNFNFFDKNYFLQKFAQYKVSYSYFDESFKQIKSLKNLAVIIFEDERIQELEKKNLLFNFVTNFYASINQASDDLKKIEVVLNWNVKRSLPFLDMIDVDYITFKIDSNVESCYRNVDLEKVATEIDTYNKLICARAL